MKKLIFCLMIAFLSLSSNLNQLKASTPFPDAEKPVTSKEAEVLMQRLRQIKVMDIKKLSPTEKKELRTEVQSIRKKLYPGGYIVISAGGLILILLLLIILL